MEYKSETAKRKISKLKETQEHYVKKKWYNQNINLISCSDLHDSSSFVSTATERVLATPKH